MTYRLWTVGYGLWTVDYRLWTMYLEGSTGVWSCGVFADKCLEDNEDGIGLPRSAYVVVVTQGTSKPILHLIPHLALMQCIIASSHW